MGMGYYSFKRNEELLDDELVANAIKLLEKRYKKMANWIKENEPIDVCECGSTDISYHHNGIKCNECNKFIEVEVPYPSKGGVVVSRHLESVIKELFSARMASKKKQSTPTKKDLRNLPFSLDEFDTGEYTTAEVEYLKERFAQLMSERDVNNSVDKFYLKQLVIQELKIMQITRLEAADKTVDSMEKKREYDVYNKLTSKLKVSKDVRENEDEFNIFKEMEKEAEKNSLDDELKDYFNGLSDREQYLEKAKKRREEAGNKY